MSHDQTYRGCMDPCCCIVAQQRLCSSNDADKIFKSFRAWEAICGSADVLPHHLNCNKSESKDSISSFSYVLRVQLRLLCIVYPCSRPLHAGNLLQCIVPSSFTTRRALHHLLSSFIAHTHKYGPVQEQQPLTFLIGIARFSHEIIQRIIPCTCR